MRKRHGCMPSALHLHMITKPSHALSRIDATNPRHSKPHRNTLSLAAILNPTKLGSEDQHSTMDCQYEGELTHIVADPKKHSNAYRGRSRQA